MKNLLCFTSLVGLCAIFGCSANTGSGGANNLNNGGAGGIGKGGEGQGNGGDGGEAGGFIPIGGGGPGGGSMGNDCVSAANEDKDMDGFSVSAGDCNDCDPNVNPGAIEVIVTEPGMDGMVPPPADEDCDSMVDNVVESCDSGIALDDTDPMNGARAIDLCQAASANDGKWGVLKAAYVRADGSTAVPPNPLQYGILNNFGPNVNTQRGASMLGLSSGYARLPSQPNACGALTCVSNLGGTAPPGFPQDVPQCPGNTEINDDVALDLTIRSPKNATGYSFNFKFYSFEYPEWVCDSYNDQFISLVNPPPAGSISGNISFDSLNNPVSVNVAFFDVCPEAQCSLGPAELQGTGFDVWDDAGGTGWLKTQAPITGGSEITIRFAIWDTGDSAWDSTAVVDNFQWVANGGTVVVGTEPIVDPK